MLIDKIKRLTRDQYEAGQPMAILFGKVTNMNPLEVFVDQRFTLPADFLVVPEHLTAFSITVGGQTYEIRRGLEVGDRLILIRAPGGGQFVITGRLPT